MKNFTSDFLKLLLAQVVFASQCQRLGCTRGYELKAADCVDIDECLGNPCDSKADCFNTQGSFRCNCKNGYEGTGFECRPYKVKFNKLQNDKFQSITHRFRHGKLN